MSELYTTKITRYKIRNYLERVGLKEKKWLIKKKEKW
jgi:ribosomal protein S15P/S13E